jgi:hypothetical protein
MFIPEYNSKYFLKNTCTIAVRNHSHWCGLCSGLKRALVSHSNMPSTVTSYFLFMLSESYNTQGQKAIFTSTNRISSSVTLLQVPELLSPASFVVFLNSSKYT